MNKNEYLSQIDKVIAQGPYTDSWDSLCEHPTPKWYEKGKFGICKNEKKFNNWN